MVLVIWHTRGHGLRGGRWRRGGARRQPAGDHQRHHTDRGRGGERDRDAQGKIPAGPGRHRGAANTDADGGTEHVGEVQ